MELTDEERRVIDQKLTDVLFPERKRQAAADADIREKKALIVGAGTRERLAVPKVDAFIVAFESARMIVDDVKRHRDTIEMAEVHHGFQLIRAAGNLAQSQWHASFGREQPVDIRQVVSESGGIIDRVKRIGRERVGAIVSLVERVFAFGDGERLE